MLHTRSQDSSCNGLLRFAETQSFAEEILAIHDAAPGTCGKGVAEQASRWLEIDHPKPAAPKST
jgi:hypothetical protein